MELFAPDGNRLRVLDSRRLCVRAYFAAHRLSLGVDHRRHFGDVRTPDVLESSGGVDARAHGDRDDPLCACRREDGHTAREIVMNYRGACSCKTWSVRIFLDRALGELN